MGQTLGARKNREEIVVKALQSASLKLKTQCDLMHCQTLKIFTEIRPTTFY